MRTSAPATKPGEHHKTRKQWSNLLNPHYYQARKRDGFCDIYQQLNPLAKFILDQKHEIGHKVKTVFCVDFYDQGWWS